MNRSFKISFWSCAILAVGLRLLLFWVNPSQNFFDNHFEPIYWIIEHGTIPPKDAFWQSYQLPVFYVVSAFIGKLAISIGIPIVIIPKMLQFLSCFYGMLTLGVIYLILKKTPLSDLSKLIAFGVACFLPVHIYTSAIHSNDTMSNLFVAICVYLMLATSERKFSYPYVVLLSLVTSITLFTKYTSFVVIPMLLAIFAPVLFRRMIIPRRKLGTIVLLLIVLPLSFLGAYFCANIKNYHDPLPLWHEWHDTVQIQPRAENGLNFFNFKPWKSITTPIIAPWNIDSFWTLIYSRMWFDMEPKFLYLIDQNWAFWYPYFGWMRGENAFPHNIQLTPFTHLTGSTLIALGLIPLLLVVMGLYCSVSRKFFIRTESNCGEFTGMQIFPVLLIFNAAGIIALVLKAPVFSSIKATYFLNSLPAFAVFLGLGGMLCEKYRMIKWILIFFLSFLFVFVTVHIIHIAWSCRFGLGI